MAATRIDVEIERPHPGHLVLHYSVSGRIGDLSLPPVGLPTRARELWQHTCFEVFVRAPPSTAYYEFNFAPSMQWAAYRFSAYRREMSVAEDVSAPRIESQSRGELYQLRASLELDALSSLPSDAVWRLGLSAVIEETSGRKSFWALAHPPGKPDFHHPDCFAYELPAA
ncbi:MAG TPA: DOMON-like domain-containing protein [Stellaceae bacterium]|nr:DOMON-like domain-containing protein [Stellaceae bacterium]